MFFNLREEKMITKQDVMEKISSVLDPELMINLVDLGLVYNVDIHDETVNIKMTLTALGCPAAGQIEKDVINNVMMINGIETVKVEFVWDPVWDPAMMTEEAKFELGYNI